MVLIKSRSGPGLEPVTLHMSQDWRRRGGLTGWASSSLLLLIILFWLISYVLKSFRYFNKQEHLEIQV